MTGSLPSGAPAETTAPRTKTQIPETALGRYVHQKVLRTGTSGLR
ncbi:hypothetical protein PUR59_33515 [Streptomyces sp. SP18ES09]|nr:hypothetical protein [Streptomyces sp. SP18ES09]MEE1819922.1 hypothetical protein [Streptomyces sp. SP18ES09]